MCGQILIEFRIFIVIKLKKKINVNRVYVWNYVKR